MSDVLLLHAAIGDARSWAPQVEALRAAGHNPTAPDLPGYGTEPLRPGRISYVEYAAALLDAPATVVGCSFGGRVALELAVERPDLVERLVLVNAALPGWNWSEGVTKANDAEDEALDRGDIAAAAEANLFWLGPDASEEVRDLVRSMVARNFELVLPVQEQVESVPVKPPADARLGEITAPTLIVVGAEDVPDMVEIAAILEAGIADTRVETIEGAGHLPSLEQSGELNRLLLEFLA
ncbi:MAG: alpha/beta hydrolase [Gaiellaceae bacterium]